MYLYQMVAREVFFGTCEVKREKFSLDAADVNECLKQFKVER